MIARAASLASALTLGVALLPSLASAHDVTLDDIRIAHPFATPTPPGAPNGAAYLDITAGDEPATLVGASSPISGVVELHDMIMDDGNMQMRKLDAIEIEAGETLTMRPGGGYHLMLLGLEETLVEGETFPLTLEFAEQGEVEIEVGVQEANAGGEAADGHHDHEHEHDH
ncbi:copper chaperone PCu(A)C [Halomonas sp. ML-15]|uniref:copper chaperone PCu(A)C n=1 Tax=Halomonas sp. ML-15 TaxID=2773305 RepID=UPI00174776BE|nr:copper chaperone PCu(A)C [Halomonas sp. ML-15]MBD3896580.1 copper chaperone PCu(A)C [Halomonas sp. ML-15]